MIASAALQTVENYCRDVTGGELTVCQATIGAVNRHLSDLKRQSTPGFPYHFDANAAAVAIDFFPMLRHSIGEYAGLPFVLEPWQQFGVACMFGWKRDDDNSRKYRRAYWTVARKNGKSSLCAGLALYLAAVDVNPKTGKPEGVADVVLAATKREQAIKVIYNECTRMIADTPALKERCNIVAKQINFTHNGGSIFTTGSDRDYDGLNCAGTILDELHAWGSFHRSFYDTMRTGGASRTQPMMIEVTTAGNDRSELWKEIHSYARGIAVGDITDESIFAYIFELDEADDALDESLWPKANPNLGVSVKLEYLRNEARPAAHDPISLNRFTRYMGNRVVSSTAQAITTQLWDSCQGELSDWAEADAITAGVDLGGRDDMAAMALCARYPVGEDDENPTWRYELKVWCYIAEDTDRDLTQPPFVTWIYDGQLHACKYPITDLTDELLAQYRKLRVVDVAYDPAGGQQLAEILDREGVDAASMGQNCRHMHEPISELLQALKDGRLRHDGDPVLRWMASNAVIITNRDQQMMFMKRDSSDKIDGLVAATMAIKRAMVAPRRTQGPLVIFAQ